MSCFLKRAALPPAHRSSFLFFFPPISLWIRLSFFSFQLANKHHCTSYISHKFCTQKHRFHPCDAVLTFFSPRSFILRPFFYLFSQHAHSLFLFFLSLLVWFGSVVVNFFWFFWTLTYFPSLRSFLHIQHASFIFPLILSKKKNKLKWSYPLITH